MGSDELSDELDEENNYSSDLAQRLVGNAQGWMFGMGLAMRRVLRETNGNKPSMYLHPQLSSCKEKIPQTHHLVNHSKSHHSNLSTSSSHHLRRRSQIHVVLDADSDADVQLCAELRSFGARNLQAAPGAGEAAEIWGRIPSGESN